MKKRERLENTLISAPVDRNPVALWRHWPGDDVRAADLARAVFAFQEQFDWDFVVVLPSDNYSVTAYGLQDRWQNNWLGIREIQKYVVTRSLDWTELRPQEPARGDTGKQLECLRLLGNAFDAVGTPYILAIYSPLSQATRLAGRETVIQHCRTHPDRLHSGLNTLTESTMRFMEALRRTNIAGIFYITELADFQHFTEIEYHQFGVPYDLKILEMLDRDRWWFNVLHLSGQSPMLNLVDRYPVQVLNRDTIHAHPDLVRGAAMWHGATCGGLDNIRHVLRGTPNSIRDATRQLRYDMMDQQFILSAAAPLHLGSPISNIQAVRDAIDTSGA